MLGFCSWPTLWKRLGDLPLETGPHVLSLIQWEPLSSLNAPGPILDHPGHDLAYWSPSSQFLVASHGQTFGGTPHHPISSPRRVFSQSLASIGPECSSFMSSRCPFNTDPDEITCEPSSASCIAPLFLLAHPATPPPTSLRAEIWHESCWNYFLPEFTHFPPLLQTCITFPGMHTA